MKAIIVISDLHVGSYTGLCQPEARLDGGGIYQPNKFQRSLYDFWCDFWGNFVPSVTKKAKSITLVVNGDIIDGNHHNTVAVWANDTDTQASNAIEILKPIAKRYKTFIVRGTEAHSGPGSKAEERIARELGVSPDGTGDFSVWQLWLDVDGVDFNIAHHIGVTSSAAYETSAPMREMIAGLVEAAQWEQKLPRVIVRSHRHRFVPVTIPSIYGRIQCVITPAWQLKTPFTERIDRMRMPHIGGVVFKVEDGQCEVKEKMYPLPQPEAIKV